MIICIFGYLMMRLAIQTSEKKLRIKIYYTAGYCQHFSIKEHLRSKIFHLQKSQITLEIIFLFDCKSGDLAESLEIITVNYRILLEYFQSFCWFTSLLSVPKHIASALYRKAKACYLSKHL